MYEKLIDIFESINHIYWYAVENLPVKSNDINNNQTLENKLNDLISKIEKSDNAEILFITEEISLFLRKIQDHKIEDKLNKRYKVEFNSLGIKWISTSKRALMNYIRVLKEQSELSLELRIIKEQLNVIPKIYEEIEGLEKKVKERTGAGMNEVVSLLKEMQNNKLNLLISSPTQRTFEPKINEVLDSVEEGPVYLAGYFDQAMLPKLIEVTKKVETRIISPELKTTKQDQVNKHALLSLQKVNAKIKTHPMIHARFILTPGAAIVGSADVKSDCLGGRRYDVCIFTSDPILITDLRLFADNLWTEARLLT